MDDQGGLGAVRGIPGLENGKQVASNSCKSLSRGLQPWEG